MRSIRELLVTSPVNFEPTVSVGLILIVTLLLFALVTTELSAQTIEKQTFAHLEQIKAISADADEKTVAGYNKQMDEAWKFFNAFVGRNRSLQNCVETLT